MQSQLETILKKIPKEKSRIFWAMLAVIVKPNRMSQSELKYIYRNIINMDVGFGDWCFAHLLILIWFVLNLWGGFGHRESKG
jgi:hypothetical protein